MVGGVCFGLGRLVLGVAEGILGLEGVIFGVGGEPLFCYPF